MQAVSQLDIEILSKIRKNVSDWIAEARLHLDKPNVRVLEIAPQIHSGAKATFEFAEVRTLDISNEFNPDYRTDLCANNSGLIPNDFFDAVIVTEVLEHTLDPFSATREIHRILKPGGIVYGSTPFDFRIHGPLPDCWRFTEHGLRTMFKDFKTIEIRPLENPDRFLMPYHYCFLIIK